MRATDPAELSKAGMVQQKTALLPAPLWCTVVHRHVEPAHFDWRWRERPALALLAWEALVAIR
jgi:hypothetical protein